MISIDVQGVLMTGGMVLNDNYEGGIFEFKDGTTLDQTWKSI